MKTLFAACTALLCMGVSHISARAHANANAPTVCSAAPYATDVRQPNGTHIRVVARGNAAVHYTETTDGYTLIRNSRGVYEYARTGADGLLRASGVAARDPERRGRRQRAFLSQLDRHLRNEAALDAARLDNFGQAFRGGEGPLASGRFPATGTRKALVLLIQYPDLPNEFSTTDINDLMNQPGFNGTGSFRDYISKNSFGQLNIESDVFGWYTAQHDHAYYGYNQGFQRARQLMAEAIDAAEAAGVDFSQYDNDGDGFVDAVIGIHAGPGAEVGAQLQYIWSHRWSLGSMARQYDGVVVNDYIVNPETRPWGMVGVGVIAHEFGHALGLPDLYDTDNSSRGIGNFGLMGNGAWLGQEQTPANMNAWCKQHLTWIEPEVIESGAFQLAAADNHAACYRINTPDPLQYFLLENRQQTGNDAFLPGHGLAIWHIDESRTSLYPTSNGVNADEARKGVDLEEADGLAQLDDGYLNGDGGDLFPGTAGKTVFDAFTAPSSNLYSGSGTDISITNIYESAGVVHFRLNDPAVCSILSIEPGLVANCGAGTFDQELIITHEFAPGEGFLVVNGRQFAVAPSPQHVWLAGLEADGSPRDVLAYFTEVTGCQFEATGVFTAPRAYEVFLEETTCDPALAGTFTFEGSTVAGCDSMVHLTRQLLPSYALTVYQSTCEAASAGQATHVYTAASGCDSTVTVVTRYEPAETVYLTATTCNPAQAGTVTNTFQTAGGCDSVVVTETVLLDRPVTQVTQYVCGDAPAGTDTWVLPAASGCDSTVVVTYVPAPAWELEYTETTCNPALAGIETDLYTSVHGCDSLVTVHRVYQEFRVDFSWEVQADGSISLTNHSLGADHFVWVLSDGAVYGGRDAGHRFEAPGTYWAFLFALGESCPDMDVHGTLITVGSPDSGDGPGNPSFGQAPPGVPEAHLEIYPNPSFGPVQVAAPALSEGPALLSVFDVNGRLVRTDRIENVDVSGRAYDFSGMAPGIYTLQVAGEEATATGRLMLTN